LDSRLQTPRHDHAVRRAQRPRRAGDRALHGTPPTRSFTRFLNAIEREVLPDAVETFFSTLTRRRLKRGVFRSIVELQAAINRYLAEHNQAPRPFTWTAPPMRSSTASPQSLDLPRESVH
jgi:hypothetical protein